MVSQLLARLHDDTAVVGCRYAFADVVDRRYAQYVRHVAMNEACLV
jgi:hypothetical protein